MPNFSTIFIMLKLESLVYGANCTIVELFMLTLYYIVTDRQTDRHSLISITSLNRADAR